MLDPHIVKFYNDIRDQQWPDISSYNDYRSLPENIRDEGNNLHDFQKVKLQICDTEYWIQNTMSVCVYKNLQHVESMLALPELNEYIITGDTFMPFESRIYGLSSSFNKEDLLQLEEGYEYRIIGCCVYNMLNVVKGAYKVFENPKGAWIWDIIPGLNLALENNLNVNVNGKEYHGELLEPNKKYRFRITNK